MSGNVVTVDSGPVAARETPLVELKSFNLGFETLDGVKQVLHDIDLSVLPGEMVGLIGESGSGKTVTAKFVLGVLPDTAKVLSGSGRLLGEDIVKATRARRAALKRHIAYVPQDPMASLNPSFTVGTQMIDVIIWDWCRQNLGRYLLRRRSPALKRKALDLAADLLSKVQIQNTRSVLGSYPLQLSGGMRQRVLLALAMSGAPKLLIADEPTTALDVTIQKRTVELIQEMVEREKLAGLYITHDLGVANWLCDRTYVMLHGKIVEEGETQTILTRPRAAYTRRLIAAVPRIDAEVPTREILLDLEEDSNQISVRELGKKFGALDAVKAVSLDVRRGETFAIVGESGSGKSTIAQIVTGLLKPSAGEVRIGNEVMRYETSADRLNFRDKVQMVFQDPASSLNPRQTLEAILGLPLKLRGMSSRRERRERIVELLQQVALPPDFIFRHPPSLSGGQKQRASIARALALSPETLVLDEPTSALDVSVQARILDLLKELREKNNLTYVFISHDLGVVKSIADRVAVMYRGEILESGSTNEIFSNPNSEYTKRLIESVPGLSCSVPA